MEKEKLKHAVKFSADDYKDLIYFLGLEFNAAKRYEALIQFINNPLINKTLEGIRRNEEEHISLGLELLKRFSDENAPQGMRTLLAVIKMNLEFEDRAIKIYEGFARSASDPAIKDMYLDLIRAEEGHLNIFKHLITDIEQKKLDVVFYCPVCGWELNYGPRPKLSDDQCCPRCGTHVRLTIKNNDYEIAIQEDNT